MKNFYDLTLKGKARRLRQMVIKALEQYDLDVVRVRLLTNEQNGIFRLDTSDGDKYIMRVSMPDAGHSLDEMNSEMMFLNFIKDLPDITAPVPVKTKSGGWLATVEVIGVPQPRQCMVFSWVPGVTISHKCSPETWQDFGRLSAVLHRISESFDPPPGFTIPTYSTIFMFHEDNVLLADENRQHYDDEAFPLIRDALHRVEGEIGAMYSDNMPGLRVVHGDLHHWNVHYHRGKAYPIDFEDMMWAYPIQDIAVTLYYNRAYDNYTDLLEGFRRGYETILPWPETYPGQLEMHILARRLHLLNFIMAATELDIRDFPDYIPRTVARIRWVQDNVWTRQRV